MRDAVDFATAGQKEQAIDAYLDALVQGMEKRQLLVVVVACVSIAELMDLAAGSSGPAFGMTCCRRAKKLSDSLDEGCRNAYTLCAAWNNAHLQLHELCEISSGAPDTSSIFGLLRLEEFYGRWMGKKIELPFPTIISGETARHLVGPDAKRIAPTEHAYFSPRYLGLYMYFCDGGRKKNFPKKAAELWLRNEPEISDVYDGTPLLALANLELMQHDEAKRWLSLLETRARSFLGSREEAEANANIVCIKGWIDSHRYDGSPPIANLEKLLQAVRERDRAGNMEIGFDAECTKIWATPYLQPLRDKFCSIQKLREAIRQD